jgi:hypothetical protein
LAHSHHLITLEITFAVVVLVSSTKESPSRLVIALGITFAVVVLASSTKESPRPFLPPPTAAHGMGSG